MALTKYTPGPVSSDQLNNANNLLLHNQIVTKIDQLVDRSVTRANDGISPVCEAFTSAGGRNGTVNGDYTSAVFDTNKYKAQQSGTFTLPIDNGSSDECSFITLQTISIISVTFESKASGTYNIGVYKNGTLQETLSSESFPSSGTNKTLTLSSPLSCIKGDLILFKNNTDATAIFGIITTGATADKFIDDSYDSQFPAASSGGVITYSIAEHLIYISIPSNSFTTTPSSAVLSAKVIDWESGANIQYKIVNGISFNNETSPAGTLTTDETWNNTGNINDGNYATYADATLPSGGDNWIGLTFTETYVKKVRARYGLATANTHREFFEIYDGTSWLILLETNDGNTDRDVTIDINRRIQGMRIRMTSSLGPYTSRVYELAIINDDVVPTEDSGWLDLNVNGNEVYSKISTFTPFANEATYAIIKLIPKSSSPTAGYPSIQGVGVILN